MDEPIKMDIVWMMESDKVIQSQIFLYHSADHSEARLDWYKIPEGSYELYAGEAPKGPRFSIYLVDQIKSVEECSQKSLFPSKHFLKLVYLNPEKLPLKVCFQQKEDLKSWSEALKKTLDLGRKHRKKLEKEHKTVMKRAKSCDELDENFYDTNIAKNTVAFEVDVESTAASIRNGVVGDGSIILSSNHVTLFCRAKNYVISWHYRHVRRFGYSSSSFMLEGGHKSGPKGEGLFMFSNCEGHKMRECINTKTATLDASRTGGSNKQESDDSDCGDYTEENMDKIYSEIKKIHKKIDTGLQPNAQMNDVYADFNNKPGCEYQNENHLKPLQSPIVPEKPFNKPFVPAKPPHSSPMRPVSNPKMSEVVQALSAKMDSENNLEIPNEYSALSFGVVESKQSDSDLSSATGNLYGEALCQQNGFQQGDNFNSEYSQINYDKAKSGNKSVKGLGKKK